MPSTHARSPDPRRCIPRSLFCVGTTGPGSCNTLSVTYNGIGERVKETGSKNYLYAGPGFRLNPDAPAWDQEYWIEIEALGERIAYKHVIGGSLRTTGILGNPGIELTPREREILIGLGLGLGLALLVVTLGGIVRAPSPARAGLSVGVSALMGIVPYQAWAGGGSLPPPISGTAIFRRVVSDAIGSSLVEIDATGTIVSRSAYRPFGGIEQQWGASGGDENGNGGTSGSGSRTYYAGHDRQTDTGLVYMNARWMDPGSGGFISVDPVISDAFEPMAYNGYSYVQNNPIMFDDPTGMWTLFTSSVDLAATGQQVHVGSQEISGGGESAGSSSGSSGGGGPGSESGPAPAGPSGVSVSSGGGATTGVSAAPAAGTHRNSQGSQSQDQNASGLEQQTLEILDKWIDENERAKANLEKENEKHEKELVQLESDIKSLKTEFDMMRKVKGGGAVGYARGGAIMGIAGRYTAAISRRETLRSIISSNLHYIQEHGRAADRYRQDRAELSRPVGGNQ